MANVSLQPAAGRPGHRGADRPASSTGSTSSATSPWSIDMQRYNFQFTGQRFYRISDGKLAGQVKDAAYQATTTDFWGSMGAVGGRADLILPRARSTAGRRKPGQVAAVSHGCPTAAVRRRPDPQHAPRRLDR